MNQDKLNHIALNPSEISTEDARELDELTRNFPYFTLPYVLLSKYYASTQDYRFEETLHKTALRIHDRAWLHEFIHEPALALDPEPTEVKPELEAIQTEIISPLPLAEVAKNAAESTAVVENQVLENPEPIETFELDESEKTAVVSESFPLDESLIESLGLPMVSGMIELDNSQDTEDPTSEFDVFEEIAAFDEKPTELQPVAELMNEDHAPVFELRETLIEPDFEAQGKEPSFEDMLPDFHLSHNQQAPKPDFSKAYAGASVYNIEDYYPAQSKNEKPDDFFTWLSNPDYHAAETPSEKNPEPDHKTQLIDKFIREKPVISQPKADFFNAAEVAKKSDNLPAGLVTETLASVYMQQGNFAGAIRIYDALILKIPQKSTYFAALIEKIKKEHNL